MDEEANVVAKLVDGISIRDLVKNGFTEFSIDTQDSDLWDLGETEMRTESYFEYDDIKTHYNLDCVKCDPSDVNGCDVGFDALRKEMVEVTNDGKVMKKVLRSGTVQVPKKGFVYLHYNLYKEMDELPFDSSYLRRKDGPERMAIGSGGYLEGFTIAVQSMSIGEKAQFLIHPDLAFGAMGAPPRIPQNATIMADIEVFKAVEHVNEDEPLSVPGRKDFKSVAPKCRSLMDLGKDYYMNGNVVGAVHQYQKAEGLLISCALHGDDEEEEYSKLLVKLYINLTICYNRPRLNKPGKVCIAARKAFEVDAKRASQSTKLFFNRGIAYESLGEYQLALKDLKRAQTLSPNDSQVNERLKRLNDKIIAHKAMEKTTFARCLGLDQPAKVDEEDSFEDIDEECRQCISEILEQFARGTSSTLQLSTGYTAGERAWLKKEATRLGLAYSTQVLHNGQRDMTISKF